jgi:hypothetical protein
MYIDTDVMCNHSNIIIEKVVAASFHKQQKKIVLKQQIKFDGMDVTYIPDI